MEPSETQKEKQLPEELINGNYNAPSTIIKTTSEQSTTATTQHDGTNKIYDKKRCDGDSTLRFIVSDNDNDADEVLSSSAACYTATDADATAGNRIVIPEYSSDEECYLEEDAGNASPPPTPLPSTNTTTNATIICSPSTDEMNHHYNHNELIDVTDILYHCSKYELNVRDPFVCNIHSFSLQDAMGATHLMDPKMDCCVIPYNETSYERQTIEEQKNQQQQKQQHQKEQQIKDAGIGIGISVDDNTNSNTTNTSTSIRVVYPRPIPIDGIYDCMAMLPWDEEELGLWETSVIVLHILVRFQSLLEGSSVGESTFTCLYANCTVLHDMNNQLQKDHQEVQHIETPTEQIQQEESLNQITNNNNTVPKKNNFYAKNINSNNPNNKKQLNLKSNNTNDIARNDNGSIFSTSPYNDVQKQPHKERQGQGKRFFWNKISQKSVFASSLALVEMTEVVRGVIANADIYEEEDFSINTFSIPFYTDQVSISARSVLESTICYINDVLQQIQLEQQQSEVREKNDPEQRHQRLLQIIQCVLEYQLDFLDACSALARLSVSDLQSTIQNNVQVVLRRAVQTLQTLQHELEHDENVKQQYNSTKSNEGGSVGEEPLFLQDTSGSGSGPTLIINSSRSTCTGTKRVHALLQKTFDSYMNRPSVGNIPVRKIRFNTPLDAIKILCLWTLELDTILCHTLLHGSSLRRICRMLDGVNRRCIRSSSSSNRSTTSLSTTTTTTIGIHAAISMNILTRSLLLLNLYFDERLLGQYSLKQFILDDIARNTNSNPQPVHSPTAYHLEEIDGEQYDITSSTSWLTSSEHAKAFLNRLAKPLYDFLKLRLLNRNRHRAYIEAVCLPDWILLYEEAQVVDTYNRRQQQQQQQKQQQQNEPQQAASQSYFSQYVIGILLALMDRYIESGIEVGLFQSIDNLRCCDLSFAFWYRAFLLSARCHDYSKTIISSAQQQQQQQQQQHKENNNHQCHEEKSPSSAATGTSASSSTSSRGSIQSTTKQSKKKNHNSNKQNKVTVAPTSVIPQSTPKEVDIQVLEDIFEYKFLMIKRNLCRKIIEFFAALQQAEILPPDEDVDNSKKGYHQFTSAKRMYEKRFEVFQHIRQPPPLSYEHYRDGVDFSNVSQEELFQSASSGFQTIRCELEQLANELASSKKRTASTPNEGGMSTTGNDKNKNKKTTTPKQQGRIIDPMYAASSEEEIKALIKVCVGNSVYLQKLKQLVGTISTNTNNKSTKSSTTTVNMNNNLLRKGTAVQVVLDFDTHNQFCTIKLMT